MTPLVASIDTDSSHHAPANGQSPDYMSGDTHARSPFSKDSSRVHGTDHSEHINDVYSTPSLAAAGAMRSLSERIQLLMQTEGGAGTIARICGVSEGTVRNWRDGHSDMSRQRCVVLAQALGISVLWLITGEGAMKPKSIDDDAPTACVPPTADFSQIETTPRPHTLAVDPHLLAAALRLLQSYIGLIGGSLSSDQRANVLAELYELLGRASDPGHAERLIAFHATLSGLLHGNRHAMIA